MNVPKIRFRDFNNDYISRKLSDISELTSSKRIYLSDYVSDGIPFYRGKEITELKANKNVSDLLYITKEKYNEIKIKYGVPEKNDILITGVGTLGNIYRVPNDNPFYFKDGNLIWLKNIKENSKYIEYNLERNKRKILDSAIGSTQKALTIVGLSKLEFNFPSLNEQTKVSNFLSLIDKKIELQSKKIEDLKLFKKGLNYKIFSSCKYEYTLKDILMEYNKRTKVNNEYEVLSSTANGIYLQSEYFNKQAASNDTTGYKIIPRGYITYRSMSDTGEFHFNIQNIVNYGIVSPAYPVFNIDETKVNKNYLIYYMNENKNFINTILSTKEGGTRFALSYSKLLSIKIKIPSREEQDQFASLISDINKKIDLEKLKLDNINSLKKGLMQNMFV